MSMGDVMRPPTPMRALSASTKMLVPWARRLAPSPMTTLPMHTTTWLPLITVLLRLGPASTKRAQRRRGWGAITSGFCRRENLGSIRRGDDEWTTGPLLPPGLDVLRLLEGGPVARSHRHRRSRG